MRCIALERLAKMTLITRLLALLVASTSVSALTIPGFNELNSRWWDSTAKVTPCTVTLDGERLVKIKLAMIAGTDPTASHALSDLLTHADYWMDQGMLPRMGR